MMQSEDSGWGARRFQMEHSEPGPRVLMVSAEIAPWAKVGGLGDVLASLPAALCQAGAEVVVAVPHYQCLQGKLLDVTPLHSRPLTMGWANQWLYELRILKARHPAGFSLLLVDCPALFDRPGVYHAPGAQQEYGDNLVRWVALCRGALFGALLLGGQWDVVHAHDMHAALSLPLVREKHPNTPLGNAALVLSIHNLAYQGVFPLHDVEKIGLDSAKTRPFGAYEYYGRFNCLKAGIEFADGIHTVSPTYAREIVGDPAYGVGLQGLLWARRHRVRGILNGIDQAVWNPADDPLLPANYTADDLDGKAACRQALLERCGWTDEPSTPLLGLVSRLTEQKGIDLLLQAMPTLVPQGFRFVLLGTGEQELERQLRASMQRWPSAVFSTVGFDETMAHQIQAGADMLLMPSRFEPCGLAQMYAMRYGTLPIARRTGGLADTIEHVDPSAASGNGFLFDEATPEALIQAATQARNAWTQRNLWRALIQHAMQIDHSWNPIAQQYIDWYQMLLRVDTYTPI